MPVNADKEISNKRISELKIRPTVIDHGA